MSTVNSTNWSTLKKDTTQTQGSIRNLKLVAGPNGEEAQYKIRFVGEPIKFYKYFVAGKSAICADPSNCIIKKKYNLDPQLRFAVNVINRKDGLIYLAEVAPSIVKPVASWSEMTGKNPGGDVAVDFGVCVTGQKKNTRYTVMPLDTSTLTEAEKAQKPYDLAMLFKATPETEIEAKLGMNGSAAGGSAPVATAGASNATATVASGNSVDLPF